MKEVGNCKIYALSESLSPMTHMMGIAGNEALINREAVYTDGNVRWLPVLSGNAIRHRMIREPGAKYLIEQCGLSGNLTIDQLNYLMCGGSLSESSTTANLRTIADMQRLIPLVRLLGGSLRNQIVSGSLYVLRGMLVCEENRKLINSTLPDDYLIPIDPLRPATSYISQYQYTRGDVRRDAGMNKYIQATESEDDNESKSNLMIYSGQTVIAGAKWIHGFVFHGVSRLEIGALLHSLSLWQNSGGAFGGQSRIGHGLLKTDLFGITGKDFFDGEINLSEYVQMYIEHVDANKDEIAEWIKSTFPEYKKTARQAKA